MKITDLQLQQYGIYQDVSWRPVQGQLVVVMGENESGKTTLLNFIRDMLFGYRRGMWRGRRGNLGFLRAVTGWPMPKPDCLPGWRNFCCRLHRENEKSIS